MKHILLIRAENKDIWLAIKNGVKKVETRAGSVQYNKIKAGDELEFLCEGKRFIKRVKKVEYFSSIGAMLKKYKPSQINPTIKTETELRKMYASFPGYAERLKTYGLIAWTI